MKISLVTLFLVTALLSIGAVSYAQEGRPKLEGYPCSAVNKELGYVEGASELKLVKEMGEYVALLNSIEIKDDEQPHIDAMMTLRAYAITRKYPKQVIPFENAIMAISIRIFRHQGLETEDFIDAVPLAYTMVTTQFENRIQECQ